MRTITGQVSYTDPATGRDRKIRFSATVKRNGNGNGSMTDRMRRNQRKYNPLG